MFWLTLCLVFSFASVTPGGTATRPVSGSEEEASRLEWIKQELGFAEWRSSCRNGLRAHVFDFDMESLALDGITSSVYPVDSPVLTYRIECSRNNTDEKVERMEFFVRIFPSVEKAHEALVSSFLHAEAPIPYLKRLLAQEVPYGDVHFGPGLWAVGNVLFHCTGGSENMQLVKEVFEAIDKALTTEGEPSGPLPEDIRLAVSAEAGDDGWHVRLERLPAACQVVLSFRGLVPQTTAPYEVKVAANEDAGLPRVPWSIRLVVLRRAEEPQIFVVPLPEKVPAGDKN